MMNTVLQMQIHFLWPGVETDAGRPETKVTCYPNISPAAWGPKFGLLLGQLSLSLSQVDHLSLSLAFTAPTGLLVSPIPGSLTVCPDFSRHLGPMSPGPQGASATAIHSDHCREKLTVDNGCGSHFPWHQAHLFY